MISQGLKLKIYKLLTFGHAQIGHKSIKWQDIIGFFTIFLNFDVILCKDLWSVDKFKNLNICLCILKLLAYQVILI